MTDGAASLADRVVELVDRHWREHAEPLLLSQLGGADQGEVGRQAKAHSGGLAAFVRDNAADRVRVASGTDNPLVMAAVPANVEQEISVDDLLGGNRGDSALGGPRYLPAFWAAFRVPLDEGRRRFVSTCAPFRFEDMPAAVGDGPEGHVEVTRQYIADADAENEDVRERIESWLGANGLDGELYVVPKKTDSNLPRDDLLGHLLLALEAEDLKRMTIPLDVVRKLRQRAV